MRKKQHLEHVKNCIFGKIASAPNDSKMTLNTTRSKVPHVCSACVVLRVPDVTPFRYTISHFQVICHFSYLQLTTRLKFILCSIVLMLKVLLILKCQKVTFVWAVTGNTDKKFVCKSIIIVQIVFWKWYFQKNRTCTEWPLDGLGGYNVKGTPYSDSQTYPRCALQSFFFSR